jgi:hypothetical protein
MGEKSSGKPIGVLKKCLKKNSFLLIKNCLAHPINIHEDKHYRMGTVSEFAVNEKALEKFSRAFI